MSKGSEKLIKYYPSLGTKRKTELFECSLCDDNYTGFGNNAEPFNGRCCDKCNKAIVIPMRLHLLEKGLPIRSPKSLTKIASVEA